VILSVKRTNFFMSLAQASDAVGHADASPRERAASPKRASKEDISGARPPDSNGNT